MKHSDISDIIVRFESCGKADNMYLPAVKHVDITEKFITFKQEKGALVLNIDKLISYSIIKD